MKRTGHLLEQIVEYENLRRAVERALRGKRHRPDARWFVDHLDTNLRELREQLLSGSLALGCYHQFVIYDPKERVITAPCFRERVLHHAVINICEPILERWLIDDTYACRRGRGRIVALQRTRRFSRRYAFYLKLDIRKYFDSVPHPEIKQRLRRLFKDPKLLMIFDQIIDSFRPMLQRGLPIGSLTSQHFANFYLAWFDRFAKEQHRLPGYVRYMDDMLLWSNSKADLRKFQDAATDFLACELKLQVKESPYINRSGHGVDFLGCRVFPWGVTLNRRSRVRYGHKLRQLERDFAMGAIDERDLQQRATALTAFATGADVKSWKFRKRVLKRSSVSSQRP
jgi:retron-type reverse transcriptase